MTTATGPKWCRYGVTVLCMALTTPALAEDDCAFTFTGAQVDQDLFLEPIPGVNEDRDFTMGLSVRFNSCRKGSSWFSGHEVQHAVLGLLSAPDARTQFAYSTAFESFTYTPDNLPAVGPVFEDKPYASVLQVTNSLVAFNDASRSATEVSLSLGFLGLPISEWTQRALHQTLRSATGSEEPFDPKGWNNQISNGGEPTGKLGVTWFYRQDMRAKWVDLVYSTGATLGYQTGANVGVTGRFGAVNKQKPVWQTSVIGVTGGSLAKQNPGRKGREGRELREQPELYGILSNRLHFVGYNALLQGQFRSNPHELSSSEIERLVFENTIGVGWQKGGSDWLFSCTRRSADFDLAERRDHFYCSLNFARSL